MLLISLWGYLTNTVLMAKFAKTISGFKLKLNSLSLYTSGNTGFDFQMSAGLLSKTVRFYTDFSKSST